MSQRNHWTPQQAELLSILTELWQRLPEQRFGQLVLNVSDLAIERPSDVWEIDDLRFLKSARQLLEEIREAQKSQGTISSPVGKSA